MTILKPIEDYEPDTDDYGGISGWVVVVLDTPQGKILQAWLEESCAVELAPRGAGSVRDGIVGNDYKLITLDIVPTASQPSQPKEGQV